MALARLALAFLTLGVLAATGPASSPPVAEPYGGPLLATVNKNDDTLWLVRVATGEAIAKLPTGPHPQEVAFSPDGKLAVVSNMGRGATQPGKTLTVVDVPGRKVLRQVDLGEHGMPHGVEFLDADRVLMTSHATDSLVRVNIQTGKVERAVASGGKGTHLAVISPDRTRAYAINVLSADLSVLDLKTFEVVKRIPCGTRAEGVSVSPDGKWVAVGNVADHTVTIIDAAKLDVVKTLTGTLTPIRTFFTSDSRRLLVSCPQSGDLAVFAVGTFEELPRVKLSAFSELKPPPGQPAAAMNWARSKDRLYVVIVNANQVAVLNESTLKLEKALPTGPLPDGIAVRRA